MPVLSKHYPNGINWTHVLMLITLICVVFWFMSSTLIGRIFVCGIVGVWCVVLIWMICRLVWMLIADSVKKLLNYIRTLRHTTVVT